MDFEMDKCMGCKNCEKFCPNGAIKIQLINGDYVQKIDSEKCINCGICKKCCPFTEHSKIDYCKIYIGRIKNEELINKSSSGGAFGEIARKALSMGWIVYGAGFDEEFKLSHKRVDNINNLDNILKSKYIQSDVSQSFSLVKKDLEENKSVIFSGTPCQIAALKKYLKKDYKNLHTIDVICHGTPKNKIWQEYIKEIEEKFNSKIKNVEFRYNNEEEPEKNYMIELLDGQKVNMQLYDSIFGKAFLKNMILHNCCYKCNFNNFNNYSDITLADAHGYVNEKYPRKRSLIIIHTEKGNDLFEQIKDNLILFEDYSKETLINSNYPIIHSSIPHYNSDNVKLDNNKSIMEVLDLNLNNKYIKMKYNEKNIGILNFHYENYNYGANLVAYSLYEIIKRLGYIPYIIDYDPFLPLDPLNRFKTKALLDFRIKYLNMTPNIYDGEELKELNKYFGTFIVGSDQVWRKVITKDNMFRYFLDFVNLEKKCISYGASFGNNNFEGTEQEKEEVKILLKKFNNISVRELDAIDMIKEEFDNNASIVLDPTLLLTQKDYDVFKTKNVKSNYIAYYVLFDQEEEFINRIHKLFPDKELINIKGKEEYIPLLDRKEFKYNTMEEWVSGIRDADFVVTDSYHGMLFSLIFNKEFICLGNSSKAKSRFDSICELLGGNIEKRMFTKLKEIDNIKNLKKLDYKIINNNITKYQKESIKFLEDALKNNIKINNEGLLLNKYLNKTEELKQSIKNLNVEFNLKINDYENNINELLKHSNNLNLKINNYENEIKILKNDKDYLNKIIEDSNEEIKKLNETIEDSNEEIKKMNEIIQGSNKENQELNEIIQQLNNQLNKIYSSKSWKATKPLRKIIKRIKNK